MNPAVIKKLIPWVLGLFGIGASKFLHIPCFLGCVFSKDPSCSHRCKGKITIFGTSVFYFVELLGSLKGAFNDLNEVYPITNAHAFCHRRLEYPNEGVDVREHPLGWIEQPDGSWTGCESQTNYPVMQNDVFSVNSFHDVKKLMEAYPRAEYEHKVHRYNEFAYAMASSSNHQDIFPPNVMIARPVEFRLKTNPLVRRLFKQDRLGKDTEKRLRNIVRNYLKDKETLNIHTAAFELVWSMIFDIIFPGEPFPYDIMETFDLYSQYFKVMAMPTMLTPEFLHPMLSKKVNQKVAVHIEKFKQLIKANPEMFGEGVDLYKMDCSFEGKHNDCHQVLSHGVLDFFALAGGAALPKLMRLAMFNLYETDERREKYKGLFMSRADTRAFAKSSSKGYIFECLRFFTMVLLFPYWEGPRGERNKRMFLNIATASKDPNVYGADAHLFRKRDHKFLADHNMAFADFIKDETLFNGGNDHFCPAKDAAIMIGSIIIEELGIDDWEIGEAWNPVYKNSIPYVHYDDPIFLKRVGRSGGASMVPADGPADETKAEL